jgi:4-hydroxybenzoate polyprenyltransferase
MYSKYLIAQSIVLFLIGSIFGLPGIIVAGVVSVAFYFIVTGIKKTIEEDSDT